MKQNAIRASAVALAFGVTMAMSACGGNSDGEQGATSTPSTSHSVPGASVGAEVGGVIGGTPAAAAGASAGAALGSHEGQPQPPR